MPTIQLLLFGFIVNTALFSTAFFAPNSNTKSFRVDVASPFLISTSDNIRKSFCTRHKSTLRIEGNEKIEDTSTKNDNSKINIVLVVGYESFNLDLYQQAITLLPQDISDQISLSVFSDAEIRLPSNSTENRSSITNPSITNVNPVFINALENADIFVGSLLFDYDDVMAVSHFLPSIKGPRLCFECATELMEFNKVGSFSMASAPSSQSNNGPPPVVKAILSKFSSGKEEDKLAGYIKLLKIGPQLLQYVPGEKAKDLRTWLEAYRYWNQGGVRNVSSMIQLLYQLKETARELPLPKLEVTPDNGLLHPLHSPYSVSKYDNTQKFFLTPKEYIRWRESNECSGKAIQSKYKLASLDSPRVAVLLYRKHVITKQKYIWDIITQMESEGILPIPIFINGVEAHTIVRDLLTSDYEIEVQKEAVRVDAIVNTIGFPLVGGPAGSMEAGRNVDVAQTLLSNMNVPYIVASPLLLQSIPQWKQSGVLGLNAVVLYSLPELDGAIDTLVLGGLVGDKIAIVPERVRKLLDRVRNWVELRRTAKQNRKISIVMYGFPPNVGAVGTAALLDVPKSVEKMLKQPDKDGYDIGTFTNDSDACGESIVAALAVLCEDSVVRGGGKNMQLALDNKIKRAKDGDKTVPETLGKPGGGLGGACVRAYDVTNDDLDETLGKYMSRKVRKAWPEKERGPGVSAEGNLVVSGLQIGNVWITVQPLLGFEGDPMRLLFERDLTPHPQYCAAYEWMKKPEEDGGIGAQAVIHFGMHGTVEWLPGQPLGNDRQSWSDQLLGSLPNIYIYAANNPSESILAKRRGYGTLVSYNVPPYGRAGLYLDLANLKELITEYRTQEKTNDTDLKELIWSSSQLCGLHNDVPLFAEESNDESVITDPMLVSSVDDTVFENWILQISDYLVLLQERLFSSGLHTLGSSPTKDEMKSYLDAYFGDRLLQKDCDDIVDAWYDSQKKEYASIDFNPLEDLWTQFKLFFDINTDDSNTSSANSNHHKSEEETEYSAILSEASHIVSLLGKNTEELDGVLNALDGGYVRPAPGGDLLRDGSSVLPTGRNIHALDPYRMPSASAWARGQRIAEEIVRQHRDSHDGLYPETVAVTLWGLDTIKTRGESIAIVLALVGAYPVKEGTGRVVRYDLIPLEELGRPRIDVLASLSGIFRDSFANVVDLLDDMFERAASVDESNDMNYIKKHCNDMKADGVDRAAARLFSNPPGDYGSMVNEVVGSGEWEDSESLGETWMNRNTFSYGRNEGIGGVQTGTARPQILDKLLSTTELVVQEVDSVEYGITDIQEYYANTGALKKAAENRKSIDPKTGKKRRVGISVVEAFGANDDVIGVQDVEDLLRLEYRSKLLNPKWRDAMIEQGSGGAYEISQRMTAVLGWAATAEVDNFVFDQAAERYALDEDVAMKLQRLNPEAFKNIIRRLLEAEGRDMWETDQDTLGKLRDLYSDADDMVEQVGALSQK